MTAGTPAVGVPAVIPPGIWNQTLARLPMFEQVSQAVGSPSQLLFAGVIGGAALFMVYAQLRSRGDDTTSVSGAAEEGEVKDLDLSSVMEENKRAYGDDESESAIGEETGPGETDSGSGRIVREISEEHKSLLSASGIENDPRHPLVGEQYVQTFYVPASAFPETPVDGFLSPIFSTTDVQFDVTMYFDRENQNRAKARFRAESNDAKAEKQNADGATITKHAEREQKFNSLYEVAQEGTAVYKTSLYISVRGDTVEELDEAKAKLRRALADESTQLSVKTALGRQTEALQSVSPIGEDTLGLSNPEIYRATAMSGVFGAAYASFVSPTEVDPNGVEFGRHKGTKLPVFEDVWTSSDTGNAMFQLAEPGGGKSTTGKALMNRIQTQRDDVISVIIEPMGNWEGLAKAHGAEHITVGGDRGINPLEINGLPEDKWDELADDEDPLGSTIESAIAFLENYFDTRGLSKKFAEHRTLCEEVVSDAFYDAGITTDLSTHSKESPTLRDVRHDQLKPRMESPEDFVDSEQSVDNLRESATWLYEQFKNFDTRDGGERAGAYANFGEQTDFSIRGEDMVYLDLGQSEGSVSEKAVLTMHILLEKVYEMAKETDKKVIVAMDEFRYFIRDVANIHSIENLFRHHRHHDISPWIMTQTAHEFFQRPEAEAILDACAFTLAQRYEGMSEGPADSLGFSRRQYQFVTQEAQAGDPERGYADALLGVGGDFRKLEVVLRDEELAMSEWDAGDPLHELPGYERDTVEAAAVSNGDVSPGETAWGAANTTRREPAADEPEKTPSADGGVER